MKRNKLAGTTTTIDARKVLDGMLSAEELIEGPNGEIAAFLQIAPDLAQAILEQLNHENIRNVIAQARNQYADDQKSGEWHPNYDPLVFGPEWQLWNGQHRLSAQVISGESLQYIVVFGAPENVLRGQDDHRRRTIGQTHGVSNAQAATAVMCMELLMGRGVLPTRSQRAKFVDDHRSAIDTAISWCNRRKITKRAPVMGAFALAFHIWPERQQALERLLEDIVELKHTTAVARAMVRLLEARRGLSGTDRWELGLAIVRGIDAYFEKEEIQILRPNPAVLSKWQNALGHLALVHAAE